MKNKSKWSIYNKRIKEELQNSPIKGAHAIASIILGKTNDHVKSDSLASYIKRNFKNTSLAKILVYDLETSLVLAKVFWAGKQFVNAKQLMTEPNIISVSYKWLGSDKVHSLSWNNGDDKELVKKFLKIYNQADMVIGINNNNFDNRWMVARAMKYNLYVNTYIKSFDVQRKLKSLARLPGYSMAYISEYFNVIQKQSHEGIIMWEKIQWGTKKEKKEYLQKMIDYNIGDIITTEELYYRLRRYMPNELHIGQFESSDKHTCPTCGGKNLKVLNKTTTRIGNIQVIMQCKNDKTTFKISNSNFLKNYLFL